MGMFISGIVLTSVGGLGMIGGAVAIGLGHTGEYTSTYTYWDTFSESYSTRESWHSCDVDSMDRGNCSAIMAGFVALGVGTAVLVTGAVLLGIGNRKVRTGQLERDDATPTVSLTPGGVSVSF